MKWFMLTFVSIWEAVWVLAWVSMLTGNPTAINAVIGIGLVQPFLLGMAWLALTDDVW